MPALKKWLAAFLAVLCLCFGKISIGATFAVNPIGFNLNVARPSGVLQIKNNGDDPVRIQVSAVDWQTDGHREVLQDTDDLALNPPIFSLAPGKVQFLRFGIRQQTPSDIEKTYRLLIEEVPTDQLQTSGLQTLLQISIPIFIAPEKPQEKLSWQLVREKTGLVLTAINDGNVHKKILRIQLDNVDKPDSHEGLLLTTTTYVLSGQRKEWPLAGRNIHDGKVRLHIQTDKGDIEEFLTLEATQLPGR